MTAFPIETPSMSFRVLLPALLAASLAACVTQQPVTFSQTEACTETATAYETREVQCRVPAQFAGKLRFKANFSGGHDDTVARLESFWNDAPLACNEGSKTWLSAEEGDVSLWCDFPSAGQARDGGVFNIAFRWSHAEYVNYQVEVAQ
jgi:hypothetical protein